MIRCHIVLGSGKSEAVLSSPLLATGADAPDAGAGEALGALVTPEYTAAARRGAEQPALVRTTAGYLLATGRRNPGVRRALREHGRAWSGLGRPVCVSLYGADAGLLGEAAELLAGAEGVHALLLSLPHDARPEEYGRAVRRVLGATMLPCLVRCPFDAPREAACEAAAAGADAVVVSAPPLGRALREDGSWAVGPLHSPALVPLTAERVHQVRSVVSLPIVARGGVATLAGARSMLAAGADALLLDSILFVEPDALATLYAALEEDLARQGAADWEEYVTALRGAADWASGD